jgi:teichuronic acid biosynthesis glycosyltransferase TuaG
MKDLISVIIPFYKKKKYFFRTINSLKSQSYQNFEAIIIYDDLDKSDLKFVKKTLKAIKKKKILINNKNLGAGLSRNRGIEKASGTYIAFLDADDIWHKNKLKLQLKFLKKNKAHFCYSSYQIINKNEKIIKKIEAPTAIDYKNLMYSCDIGLSSVMMHHKILQKNKFTNLKTKEDYLLWLRLSKIKIKMRGMKPILFSWRKTDNSLSSSVRQKLKDAFSIYNKHMKFNFLKSIFLTILLSINFILKRFL